MDNEFLNRIDLQRKTIQLINKYGIYKHQINSLTFKGIDKWTSLNSIDSSAAHVKAIYNISEKLFFLANKSQEQVSPEYRNLSLDIADDFETLSNILSNLSRKNLLANS